MIIDPIAANDCEAYERQGVSVGLLASAIIAGLRFCRTEAGQTVMLEGAMTFGVLQDDRATRSA
jgi:hypothetical protein